MFKFCIFVQVYKVARVELENVIENLKKNECMKTFTSLAIEA